MSDGVTMCTPDGNIITIYIVATQLGTRARLTSILEAPESSTGKKLTILKSGSIIILGFVAFPASDPNIGILGRTPVLEMLCKPSIIAISGILISRTVISH